jgi:hypothetical protein
LKFGFARIPIKAYNRRLTTENIVAVKAIFRVFKGLIAGFVRVLENLESHGISIFQNPGLEILENQF